MRSRYWFGSTLLLMVLCVYLFDHFYEQERSRKVDEIVGHQKIHAKQAASSFQQLFQEWNGVLSYLSRDPSIIELDEHSRGELEKLQGFLKDEIRAITRTDSTGKVLFTVPYSAAALGADISKQQHVRAILAGHTAVVSDVFEAVQGFRAIAIHYPVFRDDRFDGTIAFVLNFGQIAKRILDEIQVGISGRAWLLSNEGVELYCPLTGHVGRSIREPGQESTARLRLADSMLTGNEGIILLTDDKRPPEGGGAGQIAYYLPVKIDGTFWALAVTYAEDEITASISGYRDRLAAVLGLILLGSIGLSYFGIRGWITVREIEARHAAERELHKSEEALQASERRFHQLFDEAPVGYHELDNQGRIVEVNTTELTMLGYRAEEMVHHPVWEFVVDGDASREAVIAKIAGTLPSDHTYERAFRKKDGTSLHVLIKDRALRSKSGTVTGIRSTLQDITDRKKAERQIQLMAQTVSSAQDCISITDLEDRILFVNDAFQKTYGYAAEELIGKPVSILRSPRETSSATDPIRPATLKGGWHGELLNRRKDGTDLPVELWTSLVRDESSTAVAIVGVARNITERRANEEHLEQSEEQFRLIAENVADMIALLDLDGKRIYNSPSYRTILGDPDLLKGTDGFREIHPVDREKVRRVFRETVMTGRGQQIEYRFLLRDGSVRDISSRGSVIRDSDGRISRVLVVSRDVTEEKLLAAQFLRAQRMESIGTLASGIAHDLNNVLAPIMMAIEVLRTKVSGPQGQDVLNVIETSAKRGSDIVKQVLAFGRGVKGDRILVQLKHIVKEVVTIAGGTFPKSIHIETDIVRDLWTVKADPTQMHQVLLNIMVNARDAMPDGGTLSIAADNLMLDDNYARVHLEAKPGAYVTLAITDTGTGMPAETVRKIFDPFFTTKEVGVGTGLGLSTTIAIIKGHDGFINVYSEVGKGTTFRIYIPATDAAPRTTAAGEEADAPMGNGELILIIDDEAAIREITKETLEACGYKAVSASNGAEGITVFAEHKDVIMAVITDIMMPVMSGTAAIVALHALNPDVKIIATSGLVTQDQLAKPSEYNVQVFLRKPYTAATLLGALARVLHQRSP